MNKAFENNRSGKEEVEAGDSLKNQPKNSQQIYRELISFINANDDKNRLIAIATQFLNSGSGLKLMLSILLEDPFFKGH